MWLKNQSYRKAEHLQNVWLPCSVTLSLMKRLIQYKRPNMQQLAPWCSRYYAVYLSKKSRLYKYISIYVYTYLYKHIFWKTHDVCACNTVFARRPCSLIYMWQILKDKKVKVTVLGFVLGHWSLTFIEWSMFFDHSELLGRSINVQTRQ